MTTATKIRGKTAALRIAIDGIWSARDFEIYFQSLRRLYVAFSLARREWRELYEGAKYSDTRLKYRSEQLVADLGRLAESVKKLQSMDTDVEFDSSYEDHVNLLMKAAELPMVLARQMRAQRPLLDVLPDELQAPLRVLRCNYASPGVTDLVGIAEAIAHLKDFVLELLRHYSASGDRKVDLAMKRQKLRAAELENAGKYLDLLKKAGYTEVEIKRVAIGIDGCATDLMSLIDEGKITAVTEIDE